MRVHNLFYWNQEKFDAFKVAYAENKEEKQFTYDGNLYITNYAKYLIEYLSSKFKD